MFRNRGRHFGWPSSSSDAMATSVRHHVDPGPSLDLPAPNMGGQERRTHGRRHLAARASQRLTETIGSQQLSLSVVGSQALPMR